MSSQIQVLSDKFNSLLTQYTDMYKNLINVINSNDTSLTTVNDSSFIGENNLYVLDSSTLDECKSSCETNKDCTGATFNNQTNSCLLNGGNGSITPTKKMTAIVQQALKYSYNLQGINTELININNQIMVLTQNSANQYTQTQEEIKNREQLLYNNYQTLLQERDEITEMVMYYDTIDAAYEDGNIIVSTNYYRYIFLLIIVIFLALLFISL